MAEERLGLRLAGTLLLLVTLSVPFGVLLYQVHTRGPLTVLDVEVIEAVTSYARRHSWLLHGAEAVTLLGSTPVLLLLAVALTGALALRNRPATALFAASAALGSVGLNQLVKHLVDRARPLIDEPIALAGGWSFPSGHAMNSTVIYGTVVLVLWIRLGGRHRLMLVSTAGALVGLIAASRVVLGVHYLSDVIAGILLGLCWLFLVAWAFARWLHESRKVAPDREALGAG